MTTYDGHGVLDWIPVWLHFLISHSQRELSQHGMQSHEMSRETDRKRARRALSPGRVHRRPLPCAHSAIAIRQKRHIQSTPLLRPTTPHDGGRTPCGQPVSTTTTTQLSRASSQKLPLRSLARSLALSPSLFPPLFPLTACLPARPRSRHQVAGFLRFVQKWCHSLKPPPPSHAPSLGPSRPPLPVLVASGVGGKEEGGGRI